jgi:Holliday junction resolvase RusA-like endonuclease
MSKFIIHGQCVTKKNSINLVGIGKPCPVCGKRPRTIPLPSKAFKAYEALALPQLIGVPNHFGPVHVMAHYWLKTAKRPDLNNLMGATADILQAAGIIQDDVDIISWDGTRIMGIDREEPRVEIEIDFIGGD